MTRIFAVAKSGKNALTSTDPNDFIFHSGYNTFKILAENVLTGQTIDSNPKTITVAHNQSHTPTFYAFAKFPDGKVAAPDNHDFSEQVNVSAGYGQFTVEVDATNIYFIFTRFSSNYNVDIKYYIFESPL
jgi:hypothetical protein